MKKSTLEITFFGIGFVIPLIFLAITIANWIGDRKHIQQTPAQQEIIQQSPTYFYESDPNVFIVEQDGLQFTFYTNVDPNVIDVYIIDVDGTHEFTHEGQKVNELHHVFTLNFGEDIDRDFVKRQYKFLIKEFYKQIDFVFK